MPNWKPWKKIPTSEDILGYRDKFCYREKNDIERMHDVLRAILDSMSGRQRLDVLNVLRNRESREDDFPCFVATEEEEVELDLS